MTFDQIIGAGSGYLLGIRLVPISQNEIASVTLPEGTRVQYEEFHSMLGHPGTSSVQRTAEYLGLNLSKPIEKCSDCATAKMRQKNIPKENVNRSSVPGERLCIDTSSVKSKSYGGNKYWSLAVDDATGMTFASFIARKGQVKEHIVPLIHQLRNKGKTVKYIRCDNAGENIKLKEECDRQKLGIEFEFTAPNTPQQNGVVERKFATLYGRGRALLNKAGFNRKMRKGLWAEAARIATLLDSITVKPGETKCPYELFFGTLPNWARYLRTFGEVGIVKSSNPIQNKLDNKGQPCIFVGYPGTNHAGNVYRFFTTDTHRIIHSRDVQWMNQLWRKYAKSLHQPAESDDDIEAAYPYSILYDSKDINVQDSQHTSTDNPNDQGTPVVRVTQSGRATAPTITPTRLT